MYHSSDQFYTEGGYYQSNPGWHQEGSKFKADLVLEFINKFQLSTGLVVEVGCGAGEVLAELMKNLPSTSVLKGYDISPQAIQIAAKKAISQLSFYVDDYTQLKDEKADLVLVLDVVEHIDDVYSFLRRLRDRGKNFIFHIPLDMSCRTLLKPHVLLQQRTDVGHIHYFTEEIMLWMLRDVGFDVQYLIYTKPDVDLIKPASFKQWVKKVLRKLSYSINKKLSVKLWGGYSALVLAKPVLKPNE
ncbi:MAG: class I SAM-dependent methyltransferase [Chitinophagaceae bacterium]